jgi:hypothetical protein
MKDAGRLLWLLVGLALGGLVVGLARGPGWSARAGNDRFEDFALCTGPVGLWGKVPLDGVWLLDYANGKLLGTVIDRNVGRVVGWTEMDLAAEFDLANRPGLHFLMTTGQVAQGQAALYVAETTSGKFGVFTLGPRLDNLPGVQIRRHDLGHFR